MEKRATTVEIADGIARIGMDDGKVNALSVELLRELGSALDEAEQAGAVVVLRGRAGVFSAGFDLATFKAGLEPTVAMLRAGADLIARLLAFPLPVLTVCTGHAYPAGAFLMLAADVRLGVAGPFRIGMNETAIGLTVPLFALELARHRLTAPGLASVASAAMFGPEDAVRLGYLDRAVEPMALEGAVAAEAARLRALDMPSFAATKARVNRHLVEAIRAAARAELPAAA